jgi:hypothetical protein
MRSKDRLDGIASAIATREQALGATSRHEK